MKFTGCNPLKSLTSSIEIVCDGVMWDLHNVGEFQGFSFICKERKLIFNWVYFDENGHPIDKLFRLEFLNVSAFEAKKRDNGIPFSEDDCLSEIIFNEMEDSFILKFMGGQEIIIFCNELKLR